MIRWFKKKRPAAEPPAPPAAAPEEAAPLPAVPVEVETPSSGPAAGEAGPGAEPATLASSPLEAEVAAAEEAKPAARSWLQRLRERLSRTREALSGRLDRLFLGRRVIDDELLDELEELLITADLGVDTSLALIAALRDKVRRRELHDPARLKAHLHEAMVNLLEQAKPVPPPAGRPQVIMIIGVNGVGKTTTIAKLAHQDLQEGRKVLLVAADTFRAAAIEQLEVWGQRLGVPVIRQKTGADPAAVVYDGLAAALAREVDRVYIDTAGRLHTKVNLMEELKKIKRTAAKQIPGAPHEIWLVLDATTGQNAVSQARLFHEAVGVTGLIMTKLDGTAKGGVALGVVKETGVPLRYLGVGERLDDLRPFVAADFVAAILE